MPVTFKCKISLVINIDKRINDSIPIKRHRKWYLMAIVPAVVCGVNYTYLASRLCRALDRALKVTLRIGVILVLHRKFFRKFDHSIGKIVNIFVI